MKKAQILSALALAFALGLGVVAPVANTYAAVTPRGAVTDPAEAETTKKDVVDAIAKAEKDSMYVAYSNLDKLATKADGAAALSASALISGLTTLGVSATATGTTYQQVTALVSLVEGLPNYSAWANLSTRYAEANGLGASATDAQKDAAKANLINAINAIPGVTKYEDKGETLTQVIEYVKKNESGTDTTNVVIKKDGAATAYTFLNMDAVITAANTQKSSAKLAEDLKVALENVTNYMPENTTAQKTAKKNQLTSIKNAFEGTTPVATLKGIADPLVASSTAYGQLKSVITTPVADNQTAAQYKTALDDVIAKFEAFTGYELSNSKPATPGQNDGTNKAVTLTTDNVTVTGEFEDGVILTVSKADKKVAAFGDRKTAMYDITLTKDGKAYKFDGSAVVTIDFKDAKIDASKAGLYYVKENGTADFMKGAKFEGTKVTFSAEHFSIYAIVEDAAAGLPNTGVISAAVEGNASTTVAMVAGIATALTAAGAGVVAYRNARRSVRK